MTNDRSESRSQAAQQYLDLIQRGETPVPQDFLAAVAPVDRAELLDQILEIEWQRSSATARESLKSRLVSQLPDYENDIVAFFSRKSENQRHETVELSSASLRFLDLLEQARGGNRSALGDLLDTHRAWMRLMAERELGNRVNHRVDPSDVVQKSCIAAIASFDRFRGQTVGEFTAWLSQTHQNQIKDEFRHANAAKRNIQREADVSHDLPDPDRSSPLQRVMQGEKSILLAQAMDRLPTRQRDAVRLRHLEGWSVEQLCNHFDTSAQSIAALVYRGTTALKRILDENP